MKYEGASIHGCDTMRRFFSSMPAPPDHLRLPQNGMRGNPHRAEFVNVAGGQTARRCREGSCLAAKMRKRLKRAECSGSASLRLLRLFAAIPHPARRCPFDLGVSFSPSEVPIQFFHRERTHHSAIAKQSLEIHSSNSSEFSRLARREGSARVKCNGQIDAQLLAQFLGRQIQRFNCAIGNFEEERHAKMLNASHRGNKRFNLAEDIRYRAISPHTAKPL
jgi:hypothetical protein